MKFQRGKPARSKIISFVVVGKQLCNRKGVYWRSFYWLYRVRPRYYTRTISTSRPGSSWRTKRTRYSSSTCPITWIDLRNLISTNLLKLIEGEEGEQVGQASQQTELDDIETTWHDVTLSSWWRRHVWNFFFGSWVIRFLLYVWIRDRENWCLNAAFFYRALPGTVFWPKYALAQSMIIKSLNVILSWLCHPKSRWIRWIV